MNLIDTSHKPLFFKSKFGTPLRIYTTTFSKDLFTVFIFSIIALVLGVLFIYNSTFDKTSETWIPPLLITFGLLIPIYIYVGNRFRYIALFEKGVVIKKRFRVYEIFYRDIKKIKLVNAVPYKNLFKSNINKDYAFDVFLSNSDIISYGISERLYKSISWPRIYYGVRVIEIQNLVDTINIKINNTSNDNAPYEKP
ncbi:hypothetical protein ACEZ3G_01010 [Maribacter algicola]|uniref:Uncharacterized protein n=1 Tax=Meishania litoralis TaxID=3434685 RepID=A0ACC7LGE0_9FLAO